MSSDSTPYTDLNILLTKLVMSEETKNDMPQQSEIGRKLFHTFVDDRRRKSGKVHNEETKTSDLENKWQGLKVIKVKAADNILELKEDKSLFARLMMVCKSRPEVDIQEIVGVYEFSVAGPKVSPCSWLFHAILLLQGCADAQIWETVKGRVH